MLEPRKRSGPSGAKSTYFYMIYYFDQCACPRLPHVAPPLTDYEYDYEDGEEYDYGSDNDGEAADELIEIENAFYEGDGERRGPLDGPWENMVPRGRFRDGLLDHALP